MASVKYTVAKAAFWLTLLLGIPGITKAVEREEFRVSDDGGTAAQSNPHIAVSSGCGFVVVWVDKRNGINDIYLQQYDADGYQLGSNVKINDDSNNAYQHEPAVAAGGSGLFSSVWKDYRDGSYPFGPDIFGQIFDSALTPVGANINISEAGPDSLKESPDIAVTHAGNGLVVWADYRNLHWDIYGQRFSAAGSLVGGNFKINDDAGTYQQHAPRVATSAQGRYVVTWYDNRLGNDDIYVQRLDSTGTAVGVNVKVNTGTQNYRQAFPDVTVDPTGNFTVAWVDWRNGVYPANPDIYSRKFDYNGTPVTAETRLNSDGGQTAQRACALGVDRMGKVAAVWADSTANSWDITGQMIDASGLMDGSNACFSTTNDSNQIDPDVALDGEFRYVTWSDNRNGNWDIYASIVRYHRLPLEIDPASLNFAMQFGGNLPAAQDVIVDHTGQDARAFTVTSTVNWLTVTPSSGTTTDTVSISVNTDTLDVGTYIGALTFIDTPTQDSNVFMSVRLDVLNLPDDTLTIAPAIVETDEAGATAIIANIANDASHVALPLQYVKAELTIDSVTAGPTLPGDITLSVTMDTASGLVALEWEADSVFEPGDYYLADIHFTAGSTIGATTIDTVVNDTLWPYVVVQGAYLTPVFNSGEITVSPSTAVGDDTEEELPTHFALSQNWPNPFNATTSINFSLATTSKVTLEVFNVLGQRARLLHSGILPAGEHSAVWDGRLEDGRDAPSGVYFYRLSANAFSFVKKMVLLK